ncbi:MAG: transcriptional regulator [Hyphococcus sp.]|nr:MAG: transcriptional regulator [Marinicaulis sp.]
MLSDTLTEGLDQYEIGSKIRALRQKKGMGLVQLGQHSGLSTAMLSKIERGQNFPTLPTLLRIAMVFGVGLDHFFAQDQRPQVSVTRKKDRLQMPEKPNSKAPAYRFESLNFAASDRKAEAYFAEFAVGAEAAAHHQHEGEELVFVIKGRLTINIHDTDEVLDAGDSIYFDSSAPHSYQCAGSKPCTAIVVVTA